MSNPGFEGRSGILFVVAAIVVTLLFGALFFGSPPVTTERELSGPEARSAMGTGAFVEWLRSRGETVHTSKSNTVQKLADGDCVFVLEPRVVEGDSEALQSLVYDSWINGTVVLVLPKRSGTPDPSHPGWIRDSQLRGADVAKQVLDVAIGEAQHIGWYEDGEFNWGGGGDGDEVESRDRPVEFSEGGLALVPEGHIHRHSTPSENDTTLVLPGAQSMSLTGRQWIPILTDEGAIVAAQLAPDFFVISDPDLISNAGIGRGSNAAAIGHLIDQFDDYSGTIWMDESTHYAHAGGGVWSELFRFPLILITLHVLALALLAAWAGTQRFGPRQRLAPRFEAGREHLLDHTAELLQLAGHGGDSLVRYLALVESDVSHSLGWGELPRPERRKRLLALGQSRGNTEAPDSNPDYAALEREIDGLSGKKLAPSALLAAAHRIDAWRTETLYGRRTDGAR